MEKGRKKTQGRKKIEMKFIEDESSRRITFSKRRNGLFKKASELSTLCGVNMGVVLLNNGGTGKAYSFGSPSVNAVTNHYMNSRGCGHDHHLANYHEAKVKQLSQQFQFLSQKLDDEKARESEQKCGEIVRNDEWGQFRLTPVNKLGMGELERFKMSLEELREKVRVRGNEIVAMSTTKNNNEEEVMAKIEIPDSPIPEDWLKL